MTIELLSHPGCPHVDAARSLVRRCLLGLGLDAPVAERVGDYPSPSVVVNGRDVMGEPASAAPACRLDVPTEAGVMAALRGALRGGR